ncbi:hypothetical protein BC629DRAFT_1439759 [Irpex lacteus]|nr:hypothetical protein BC629DRAFT_1439759 [Irpex lacteus]
MPLDPLSLASGLISIGTAVVTISRRNNARSPVDNARGTLDRVRSLLDCLGKDLQGMQDEDQRGLYNFDDVAPEFSVKGPEDLNIAWSELKTEYDEYIKQIPSITSKATSSTIQSWFSSNSKQIAEFCANVDLLLTKVDKLNEDCTNSTTAFQKARKNHQRAGKRVINLDTDYGPRT